MNTCPSNKIYNPRSKRCIANNKTNVQKIIKECSEAYAKLQNKSRPKPMPIPKPKPMPKPMPRPGLRPEPKLRPRPEPKLRPRPGLVQAWAWTSATAQA